MIRALEEICNLGVWRLRDAAWIFSGYSPFGLNRHGHLRRLAGDEAIAIGSLEYRAAEEDMKAMEQLLMKQVGDSIGTELFFEKMMNEDGEEYVDVYEKPDDHFDRNWLIDQVANFTDVDVWWVDKLIGDHWLPAYINPDALSPTMLEERGRQSFVIPNQPGIVNAFIHPDTPKGLKQIDENRWEEAPHEFPLKGEVKFFFKNVKPRSRFYQYLQAYIGTFFWKEGKSQPSALELYESLVSDATSQETWEISRDEDDSYIVWKELNPPDDKQAESGRMSLNTLATRIDSWYSKH